MKVVQLVPAFHYGDAIGNDVIAIDAILKGAGFDAHVYATQIDPKAKKGVASSIDCMPELSEDDVAIYHMATGCAITFDFGCSHCRKILLYHNITPPAFFRDYNLNAGHQCRLAYDETRWLKDKVDYCIADSEWNKDDLRKMGYTCPIDVVPVIVPFEDYRKQPNASVLERYGALRGTNILFTGRVVPNKCHEDIIQAFACYRRFYDADARLFLVGSHGEDDRYYRQLVAYVDALGLDDVIFSGHIGFDEVLAYYALADVFLCQSEHEGFCVPLLEAMVFDTPIVAYDATAVPDTLDGSGVLMSRKNPLETAGLIDYLMCHEGVKEKVLAGQRARLKAFEYKTVKTLFLNSFETFLRDSNND